MLLALPIALGAEPEVVLDVSFCASLAGLAYSGGVRRLKPTWNRVG